MGRWPHRPTASLPSQSPLTLGTLPAGVPHFPPPFLPCSTFPWCVSVGGGCSTESLAKEVTNEDLGLRAWLKW